jgi:hypothetical protein
VARIEAGIVAAEKIEVKKADVKCRPNLNLTDLARLKACVAGGKCDLGITPGPNFLRYSFATPTLRGARQIHVGAN